MGRRLQLPVLLVGAGLLFPLQAQIDARRGEPLDVIRTLPPDSVLPVLAFGHRETVSDLLELQATNFLMKRLERLNKLEQEHLDRLYGAVLALDPNNAGAAVRGGMYMSSVADRPHAALAFLRRAAGQEGDPARAVHPQHPERWRLLFEQGSIHLVNLASRSASEAERTRLVSRAGELWREASQQRGAPSNLAGLGDSLAERGLSRLETIQVEAESWRRRVEDDDPLTRRVARRRWRTATSGLRAEVLSEALRQVRAAGQPVETIEELAALTGLDTSDPAGVGLRIVRGVVVSPAYEAAALERVLRTRARRWRATNDPAKDPTPAGLGLTVPTYLEAIITREGEWVVPRDERAPFPPLDDPSLIR